MKRITAIALGLALYLFGCGLAGAGESVELDLRPPVLRIGPFFDGQEIALSGFCDQSQDVILEIAGPPENSTLDIKGKLGPLWLNRGEIKVKDAPYLYLLLLPPAFGGEKELISIGIGLGRLRNEVVIESNHWTKEQAFDEFVRLKNSEHLYDQPRGAIAYRPAPKGLKQFEAKFTLPATTRPGVYTVKGYIIRQGRVEEQLGRTYQVEESYLVKFVRDIAFNHRLIYGILAVAVALLAGITMGLAFKGGKGH